ncbi:hypothetical protein IGI52_001644 [Enterococcus sp. DIV0187]
MKIGKNELIFTNDEKGKPIPYKVISDSWKKSYREKKEIPNEAKGLRIPQYGALNAIRAHWTTGNEIATVVMPTGTGKTETMFSTIVSESIEKTLIVVPSNMLRKQIYDKATHLGILRKLNMLDDEALMPNTSILASTPKNMEDLTQIVSEANIIVTSMTLLARFQDAYKQYLSTICDVLIIDEAHHIAASTWSSVRSFFKEKRILQFTATPFRNDGKKIDGKIIYNFPLRYAQKQGYFKEIEFYPIEEFNDQLGDEKIADKSIQLLENDIEDGKEHILLVRAGTIDRAKELFENIYQKKYPQYNPVLIVSSGMGETKKRKNLELLSELKSRIVVCVNMFGEGIDMPRLKIAAIHDKYKSLPITLQFIGRFAREADELGNAKIVTNIADENLFSAIEDLYQKDADWNNLLSVKSDDYIMDELRQKQLIEEFMGPESDEIDLSLLRLKISTLNYSYSGEKWFPENWPQVLEEENTKCFINDSQKVLVIVEKNYDVVNWTTQQNISELNWNLYVFYWYQEKNIVFCNFNEKRKGIKLVEKIFPEATLINGENIFRCLAGINQLMLGTVGLKSSLNGPIRYRMFAGMDIAEGISQSTQTTSIKSNVFGTGYNGKGRVSIGCSYKGKIWSRWVESIDYWMKWCEDIIGKVQDEDIDTSEILKNVLKPVVVTSLPKNSVAYRIDFPDEIEFDTQNNIKVFTDNQKNSSSLYECELILDVNEINDEILFSFVGNDIKQTFSFSVDTDGFKIKHVSGDRLFIEKNRRTESLLNFFKANPPVFRVLSDFRYSIIEGNVWIDLKNQHIRQFDSNKITALDWENKRVDITVESQTQNKKKNSIQYSMIEQLRKDEEYEVIFDDDNSGEIADIIAIKVIEKKVYFELFHCKFSHGDKPGSRVKDLYEVCGQAEKSVHWIGNSNEMINRMKKREHIRIGKQQVSRFEKGEISKLKEIQNRIRSGYEPVLEITIVQPGLSKMRITDDMLSILSGTETYLLNTYGVNLSVISSK